MWAESWSGRTLRQMASTSTISIRMDQYRLLYSAWSEQTHASPAVLLTKMLGNSFELEELVAADDLRIKETVASAITMFVELWGRLPYIPGPSPADTERWFTRMLEDAGPTAVVVREDEKSMP